jgi:carbonic anhydrase/acetyltransferase-like protein (isoleucine patch superfamily)
MMLHTFDGKKPKIGKNVFIGKNSVVIGNVSIGDESSVWFNTVIRGDKENIEIGRFSNVQDCCVLHSDDQNTLIIGDNVAVGHGVVLHGCTIRSNCIVGIRAIILNGAEIGEWSIIAAGALVTEDTRVPPQSVVMGLPGKIVRQTNSIDRNMIERNIRVYQELKNRYLDQTKVKPNPCLDV